MPTNHDPMVISWYYLYCINNTTGSVEIRTTKRLSSLGCPKVIRSDYGTENCIVAKLQIAFRMHHNDSLSEEHSYIYGPSTGNTVLSYIMNDIVENGRIVEPMHTFDWWIDLLIRHATHVILFDFDIDEGLFSK